MVLTDTQLIFDNFVGVSTQDFQQLPGFHKIESISI